MEMYGLRFFIQKRSVSIVYSYNFSSGWIIESLEQSVY